MTNCCFCTQRYLILCLVIITIPVSSINSQTSNSPDESNKIKIASCQFPISSNIEENARWIMDQMKIAHDSGANVAHFPECALSGYPGVDLKTMVGFNWEVLKRSTESIINLAKSLNIWVILGSIHELGMELKPMNSLYVINPSGEIVDRYDKQFCTGGDLNYFSAGDHFAVFEINGIRCGLLICFDVRFPELYREYKKREVEIIFQSFYNARQKPGSIHPKIMPVTAQARAATNHFYMSLTNSSAPKSWPCYFITPDGLVKDKLGADIPGILFSKVDVSEKYYDASRHYRNRAMDGKLSSEDSPKHPRYYNKKGL